MNATTTAQHKSILSRGSLIFHLLFDSLPKNMFYPQQENEKRRNENILFEQTKSLAPYACIIVRIICRLNIRTYIAESDP